TSIHSPEYYKKWAPDLYKDKVLRFIDATHLVYPLAMGAALYFAGEAYGGLGMSWFVWGFFARTVLVLHATWLVNSATHKWGYRTHDTRDDSTNLWWVALVTYGEGWHNNHHAFQTSAAHGLDWWEIDTTYIAIKLMSYVGMASDIKVANPDKKSARVAGGISAADIARATIKSDQATSPETAKTVAGLHVPTGVEQSADLVSRSA
ncbi:MAG: acyl-CoA desaturase, partial [Isosphaeraceae bacterium]